jgi:hypothetical protein
MSVYVVKCRGGFADGEFLIAVGEVPEMIEVTRPAGRGLYAYEGGEEQTREVVKWEKGGAVTRTKVVEAVYHIFRPAPVENLDGV